MDSRASIGFETTAFGGAGGVEATSLLATASDTLASPTGTGAATVVGALVVAAVGADSSSVVAAAGCGVGPETGSGAAGSAADGTVAAAAGVAAVGRAAGTAGRSGGRLSAAAAVDVATALVEGAASVAARRDLDVQSTRITRPPRTSVTVSKLQSPMPRQREPPSRAIKAMMHVLNTANALIQHG